MTNYLITGTSSGIGFAIAREYLETGARVFGISRRYHNRLRPYANYSHLSFDLTEPGLLTEDVLRKLLGRVRRVDQVILNAGMLPPIGDMRETSLEEIFRVMNVNVWANKVLIDLLSKLVPEVYQVVAISSGAAVRGARGWNAYAISKAAFKMMIQLYAKELPDTHFSSIAPGVVDTAMQAHIAGLKKDDRFRVVERLTQMRRNNEMTSPEESALRLIEAMTAAIQKESGVFLDVREME